MHGAGHVRCPREDVACAIAALGVVRGNFRGARLAPRRPPQVHIQVLSDGARGLAYLARRQRCYNSRRSRRRPAPPAGGPDLAAEGRHGVPGGARLRLPAR